MEKILDLTMTDILPTGFTERWHEAGSVVYIAGAGPVGLACLNYCAAVIVGDLNEERLAHARSFGCETINLTNGIPVQEQIAMIVGVEVDCFVDCVGFSQRARCGRREKAGCCFKSSHGNY
jgi:glutathione-independent formaldehyde dehydrogenase